MKYDGDCLELIILARIQHNSIKDYFSRFEEKKYIYNAHNENYNKIT